MHIAQDERQTVRAGTVRNVFSHPQGVAERVAGRHLGAAAAEGQPFVAVGEARGAGATEVGDQVGITEDDDRCRPARAHGRGRRRDVKRGKLGGGGVRPVGDLDFRQRQAEGARLVHGPESMAPE